MVTESSQLNINNTINPYAEIIIEEVKRRPVLWNREHADHKHRRKVNREWHIVASKLNHKLTAEEVKSKWRNLKDSFHREMKRVHIPPNGDEGKPLTEFYTGQWVHFPKLTFLKDTRRHFLRNDTFSEDDESIVYVQAIKEEMDEENDPDSISVENSEESCLAPETILLNDVLVESKEGRNTEEDTVPIKKRKIERAREETNNSEDCDIDEDLHFVKSLVPFLRKLNPVRKLIVRNEMQSLLLKEMLCEHCRSFGPQANCKCNFQ